MNMSEVPGTGQKKRKGKEIIAGIIQGEFPQLKGMRLWIEKTKASNKFEILNYQE